MNGIVYIFDNCFILSYFIAFFLVLIYRYANV